MSVKFVGKIKLEKARPSTPTISAGFILATAISYIPLCSYYGLCQGSELSRQESIREGAKADDVKAQVELGASLVRGEFGAREYREAEYWFKRAAKAGSVDAEAWLGGLEVFGLGVPKDPAHGVLLVDDAAEAGSTAGLRFKGMIAESGIFKAANHNEAANLYQEAADQGDAIACNYIGTAYLLGRGKSRDIDAAARYFYHGVLLDNRESLVHLGQMFEAGRPFYDPASDNVRMSERRTDKAFPLYMKAAEMGSTIAAYQAALLLRSGDGVKPDKGEAITLLEYAAVHQYGPARAVLGQMLYSGEGTKADRGAALAWLKRAAAAGNKDAEYRANELQKLLTQSEIARSSKIEAKINESDSRYPEQELTLP